MNVTCPQCATVFRVDPAKVPERGVRARCSVCAGLIAVRRPPPAPPALAQAPEMDAAPAWQSQPEGVASPAVAAAPAKPVAATPPPPPPPPPLPSAPVVVPVPTPAPEPVVVPVAAPIAAAPVAAAPAKTRFSNPFLQRDADPGTRARRLANSLASDLAFYYPEKRQRGLEEGNLKELFAEEIRKSWQEYCDQIGEEYANSTTFFTQALNEILAEGRPLFG